MEMCGIKRLRQLYKGDSCRKFQDLREEFNIPQHSFFTYLQVGHALEAQFRTQTLVWNETPLFQNLVKVGPTKGPISEIYRQIIKKINTGSNLLKVRERWEEDIGEISQEQWKKILEMGSKVSVSPPPENLPPDADK